MNLIHYIYFLFTLHRYNKPIKINKNSFDIQVLLALTKKKAFSIPEGFFR